MSDATLPARPAPRGSGRLGFVIWVLRRLAYSIPTIIGVIVLDFFLLQAAPGDYVEFSAAHSGIATAEQMEAARERLGLNDGILTRFGAYAIGLAQGDLGMSSLYSKPVFDVILNRVPNTLLLVTTTLVFSLAVGVVVGTINAAYARHPVGKVITALIVLIYSVPSFLKGLFLIVLFSVVLNLLPSSGFMTIGADMGILQAAADRARHMVLPVLTLSLFYIAVYARIVTASMLEVRKQNYVRTAQAKGLPDSQILIRHMLRNALLPLTTVAGIHIGMMLSGAVIVETMFAWPGLGSLAYEALFARDFQLVLGILLLSSLTVIAANILVDIVQMLIDPRIRE